MVGDKSDAAVLDGSPIQITFNGKTYTWRQHPRRVQRIARERLFDIVGLVAAAEAAPDVEKVAACLRAMNRILDFIEDYNADMAKDIQQIEAVIMENGFHAFASMVTDIYQPLFDAWLKPWIRAEAETPGESTTTTGEATT